MKGSFIFSIICVLLFAGCSIRQREIELEKKIAALNEREQQLLLKEQSLAFKEEIINEREKLLDSTTKHIIDDSLYILFPQLPGTWNVRMQGIETNCPGSAVGDTKTELWEFSLQGNSVIVKATSNNQLVRIYSGSFTGNSIKLTLQNDSNDKNPVKMTVRLQKISNTEMEGEREIIQPSGCRIVYDLDLKKQ